MKLNLTESLRTRRGHDFFSFPDDIPDLYETEDVDVDDKIVHAHFFGPSQDWYIVEVDHQTGMAFGLCDLGFGFPEWGYVDLVELEGVMVGPGGIVIIERDCYWTPKPFKEINRD